MNTRIITAVFVFLVASVFLDASAKDEVTPISELAPRYQDYVRQIPDCQIRYNRSTWRYNRSTRLPESVAADQSKADLVTYSYEYCKQGEMFYVKEFNAKNVLTSQISFDGTKYYYFDAYAKGSRLWIGSSIAPSANYQVRLIAHEVTSQLLQSPFYALIAPLHAPTVENFAPAPAQTLAYWLELLGKFKISNSDLSPNGFSLFQETSDVKINIDLSPELLPVLKMIIKEGDYEMGEYKITQFLKVKLPNASKSIMIPQSYHSGKLDEGGMPQLHSSKTEVDRASFKFVSGLKPNHFAVPRAKADQVVDVDLN